MSVLIQKSIRENADYDDMAGPLLVVIIFGLLLTLVNKIYPSSNSFLFLERQSIVWLHIWVWPNRVSRNLLDNKFDEQKDIVC